jgi:hypothetical protein
MLWFICKPFGQHRGPLQKRIKEGAIGTQAPSGGNGVRLLFMGQVLRGWQAIWRGTLVKGPTFQSVWDYDKKEKDRVDNH